MNLRVPLALVAALVAGVVMSFGQTVSPESIAPLFNSAAPVVALAAAVAMAARSVWACTAMGAIAGPLAMVGYYATAALRGYGVGVPVAQPVLRLQPGDHLHMPVAVELSHR